MLDIELIVPRPTAVKLQDMTLEDLHKMEHEHLAEIAYGLIELLKRQPKVQTRTAKRKPVVEHPQADKALPAREPQHRETEKISFGSKHGKTSKYHNVYFDKHSGKFKAGLQKNGKYIPVGSSFNELESALMLDKYLDSINDTKRPRNRDDFEEVARAYKEGNQ